MMRAQEVDPANLEVLLSLGVSHTNGKSDLFLLVLSLSFIHPLFVEFVCQDLLVGLRFDGWFYIFRCLLCINSHIKCFPFFKLTTPSWLLYCGSLCRLTQSKFC